MAHISSIGAGIFSDLSFGLTNTAPATYDAAGFAALFATKVLPNDATPTSGEFCRVTNIREFPSIGTPANIINVPVYGQKTSKQIQGQADAPNLELTINYVPADWDATSGLGKFINDGVVRAFRFSLLNEDPGAAATFASTAAGYGSKNHSVFYWMGKLEALLVNPQLTDANTATLTLSIQTDFYGAFTYSS